MAYISKVKLPEVSEPLVIKDAEARDIMAQAVEVTATSLDATITGMSAGKTLASLTETEGIIEATFQDISITKSQISDFAHTHDYILTSAKGAANGVAELDENGKVPSTQLPSYVDDVLEYNNLASFPSTGESGKIYVALDTNKTYRWGGSGYVEISESLAIGTTATTAAAGNHTHTYSDVGAAAE